MFVSHRHLLEWIPADLLSSSRSDLRSFYRRMARSVVLTLVARRRWPCFQRRQTARHSRLPFLLLWLAAPLIAWRISRTPPAVAKSDLSTAQQRELRLIARRTWRFFETFVTAEDNHLPPDNFQEDPRAWSRTAPRPPTSASICCRRWRRATSAGAACAMRSTASRPRSAPWCACTSIVGTCTTGTTRATCSRSIRATCRRSTRATSPRISSRSPARSANGRKTPAPPASAVDGLADTLDLAREALRAFPLLAGADHHARPAGNRVLRSRKQPAPAHHAARSADRRAARSRRARRRRWSTWCARWRARAMPRQSAELVYWVEATRRTIDSWRSDLLARDPAGFIVEHLESLANIALQLAAAMEFDFLLDTQRKLLSIGYRATDGTLDDSCYDLLASEARLASFIAIAKGDIPARHWFRLGRTVTPIGAGAALVSWSGSMFEYLMPDLVLRAPGGSLLAQTSRLIVKRQIAYGAELDLPWGVSESAYNARDLELTYQYSNFGVPGLGLKRGLSENKVIAPYATGPRRHDRRRSGARQLHGAGRARRARSVWLLRGGRLHAEPRSRRRNAGAGARLHGASPGHEHRRHRQRAARRPHARTLSFRRVGAGHRAAAAGTHAARCLGGASARRGSRHRGALRRPAGAAGAAHPQPARLRAADAPAVERPLLGHGHRRRIRLQPLERPRHHALARRRDARRHGQLSADARRGNAAACGRRATSPTAGPARQLRSQLHRRPRRDHSHRRRRHQHARSAGVARRTMPKCACCRSDNGSLRDARDRSHLAMPSWCSAPQSADVAHPAFSKMFVRTEFLARQKAADRQPPAPRAR